MNATKIEWCDFTWNPVVGCTHGCEFCYARKQAKRQKHKCQLCYDFTPHLHPERLEQPAKRKKPARIFVCSMGELFDPSLKTRDVIRVLLAIDCEPQHTFLLLTKRPDIAKLYTLPSNVHLGVSVTNQADADERIPLLLKCKAKVRFVSYEPAHGAVDFGEWCFQYARGVACAMYSSGHGTGRDGRVHRAGEIGCEFDWLIIGAETGNRKGKVVPKREWIESAVNQAKAAGVAVFVKNNVVDLYPEFAGIQEYPGREGE